MNINSEEELEIALKNKEAFITVNKSFNLTKDHFINYNTKIHSENNLSIKRGNPNSRIVILNTGNIELEGLILDGSMIEGNKALIENNGTLDIRDTILKDIYSNSNGGAISNKKDLILNNAEIINCKSKLNGGGIFNSGNITLNFSILNENKANNGAGIYMDTNSNGTLCYSSIKNGEATLLGGGIYLNKKSILNIKNGNLLTDNIAKKGIDIYDDGKINLSGSNVFRDGVYVCTLDNIINIMGKMEDSYLCLEESNYLKPDFNLSPIVVAVSTDCYRKLDNKDGSSFKKPQDNFQNWNVENSIDNTKVEVKYMGSYKITYTNTKGATNLNPTIYKIEDLPISLKNLELLGYNFIGWLDENEEIITEIDEKNPKDRNLYALWEEKSEYNITYDKNTTEIVTNMPNSEIVMEGENYTISRKVPLRDNYRFINWNTLSDGSGNILFPGDVVSNIESNQIYYAIWDQIPDPQITITIEYKENANGESVTNMPTKDIILKGSNYDVSNKIPKREGYTFINWNESVLGTGESVNPNQKINNVTEAKIYHAQWKKDEEPPKKITIEFDGNGEGDAVSNIPATILINSGDTLIIPSEIPVRSGYKFKSWNSNKDGSGTVAVPGQEIPNFLESEDYFAQWEKITDTVIIDFNKNSSGKPVGNMPAPISVNLGDDVVLPNDIPSRDGYIFLNWNRDPLNLGDKLYPNETIKNVESNQTLYAIWYKIPTKIIRVCPETCRCICCGCQCKISEICNCKSNCK